MSHKLSVSATPSPQDLLNENRLLRTLHKRQDLALSKYDSTNAELPQLLHSHAEEIRMWQARVRNLQSQNKDLVLKIKQKDSVLLGMTDQNRHLHQLNSDKYTKTSSLFKYSNFKLHLLFQRKSTLWADRWKSANVSPNASPIWRCVCRRKTKR